MNRGRPYTTKEIEAMKQDYICGMHIGDMAKKYGRSSNAIWAKMRSLGYPRPYVRVCGSRATDYQYAIVTNDEYELPLTTYTDSISELARITGIGYNGLLRHRLRAKRGQVVHGLRMYVGNEFVWGKLIQIDAESDEE